MKIIFNVRLKHIDQTLNNSFQPKTKVEHLQLKKYLQKQLFSAKRCSIKAFTYTCIKYIQNEKRNEEKKKDKNALYCTYMYAIKRQQPYF